MITSTGAWTDGYVKHGLYRAYESNLVDAE